MRIFKKCMLCLSDCILNKLKLFESLSCRGPEGDDLGDEKDYRSDSQIKMTDLRRRIGDYIFLGLYLSLRALLMW